MHRPVIAAAGLVVAVAVFLFVRWLEPVEPSHAVGVQVKILVPDADAEVSIDGQKFAGKGVERPLELPAGKGNVQLTVAWKPNHYTRIFRDRTVPHNAGQTIDLREADPALPDRVEVIFVPTPPEVVDAMCRLAEVGPDDIVYDLGCGDGRIVMHAVERFRAASGVGVDIDAKLVKDCQQAARARGLAGKVEFREGDVLNIKDLSRATVVMLYMGEEINVRLKPILQATLRPGARVVSHAFDMGDWQPAKTEAIPTAAQGNCNIFLWPIGPGTKLRAAGKLDALKRPIAQLQKLGAAVDLDQASVKLAGPQISDETLEHLRALPWLADLELTNGALSAGNLEQVGGLNSLRHLRMANVKLAPAGLPQLGKLTGLERLSLSLTNFDDAGAKSLSGLPGLVELELGFCPVTDAGLAGLKDLSRLRVLDLSGSRLTDAGLANLPAGLETLSLRHTGLTDAGLAHLRSLKNLKKLDLRGTKTSTDAVNELKKQLPAAEIRHAPVLDLNLK